MFSLTRTYFNFETEIHLSVECNGDDDSIPRVTLAIVLPECIFRLDLKFFLWDKYVSGLSYDFDDEDDNMNSIYNYKCGSLLGQNNLWNILSRNTHRDTVIFYMIDCMQLDHKELLNKNLVNMISDKLEIEISFGNYNMKLKDMKDLYFGIHMRNDKDVNNYHNFYLMVSFAMNYSDFGISYKKLNYSSIDNDYLRDMEDLKQVLLHSQPIAHFNEMTSMDTTISSDNYSLVVTKILRSYLGPPYSQCSHYQSPSERPFDGLSYMQCYRQCLRIYAQKDISLNCTLLLIDGSVNNLDYINNNYNLCKSLQQIEFENKAKKPISRICFDLCPKDCLTVDYLYEIIDRDNNIIEDLNSEPNENNYSNIGIVWDSRQPMMSYIETSILSLTDYLVNCGGLLGLWFGANTNDLVIWLIQSKIIQRLFLYLKSKSSKIFYVSHK